MSTVTLSPYLNFNGTCEEAMNFYKSVFGGELTLNRFGEMPMPGQEDQADQIMHATLKADDVSFMASDGGGDSMDNNIQMSLAGTDQKKLEGYFNGLAVGGMVTMPLAKQPWGDEFGMLTDSYGVKWMVNIGSDPTA